VVKLFHILKLNAQVFVEIRQLKLLGCFFDLSKTEKDFGSHAAT
jgi:hypothetical protein